MSFYKILSDIKQIVRFQLVQKSFKILELRLTCEYKDEVFVIARDKITAYLNSKGVNDVLVMLSNEEPKTNKVSGKFNHVYKDFNEKVDE